MKTTQILPLRDAEWLEPVLHFYDEIRFRMNMGEMKNQLLPRSTEYFKNLIAGRTGLLFAAVKAGAPIHQDSIRCMAALMLPKDWAAAHKEGMVTCPDKSQAWAAHFTGKLGVVQSFCSGAKERSEKFPAHVLNEITRYAKVECKVQHLLAQVGQRNTASWLRFMKEGYYIVDEWGPTNSHSRFMMCRVPDWFDPEDSQTDYLMLPKETFASSLFIDQAKLYLKHGYRAGLVPDVVHTNKLHFAFTRISCCP